MGERRAPNERDEEVTVGTSEPEAEVVHLSDPLDHPLARPLQAVVAGNGRPLVLLHAFALSPIIYQRTIDLLAQHVRVVAPWWLNPRTPRWSYEFTLAGLHRLLENLELEDAIVVGHSFGGAIATGYAAVAPERVSHLVLVNALVTSPGKANLRRLGVPGEHWRRLISAGSIRGFASSVWTRPRHVGQAGWWAYHADLRVECANVRASDVDATVIWSPQDGLLSPEYGQSLADDLGGQFHHLSEREQPDARFDHDWVYHRPGLFVSTLMKLGLLDD